MKIANTSLFKNSFTSRLVAKTSHESGCKRKEYKIYQLNKDDDAHYFDDMISDWPCPMLVQDARWEFFERRKADEFYVLENSNKEILAFAKISNHKKDCVELDLIETKPWLAFRHSNRKSKYIGETMLSFLLKRTQMEKNKFFKAPHCISIAQGFYEKCGFEHDEVEARKMFKTRETFDELIEQNEKHTGSKIELLF